ncbi:hypothetical protein HPB52_015253 [Rhipicephalus sanguineus]|uniref:Paired domain-containing protein n=1 Tax=Rhipicephalus sanguineus TaxID=34632 RepID=A0A9D4TAJ5_RHISA|nr:hypothetical protein HPB52_015253 [Rhipicephalus sanguineus]
MSPRVPADERRRIVELSIQGFSQRVICRLLQRLRNAASRAIQAYRQTGGISDRDRAGRSRCTDDEVDRLIIAAVVADPHISAKGIKDALHLNASVWTIRRRLAEAGLANCVAAQKPHITDRQRSIRLQFARSVQTWGSEEWGEVVFSDESTFSSRWDQERRGLAVRTLEWPPVGADLNPIENVWGLVKRRLAARNLGSSTKETLFAAIQEEWEALRARPEIVAALYDAISCGASDCRRWARAAARRRSDAPRHALLWSLKLCTRLRGRRQIVFADGLEPRAVFAAPVEMALR